MVKKTDVASRSLGIDVVSVEDVEDANEESTEPKIMRAPRMPSREEVESHMATHVPFRSWCKRCVRGKSKGNPHHRQKSSARDMPTVVCDYMYMHESQGAEEEKACQS